MERTRPVTLGIRFKYIKRLDYEERFIARVQPAQVAANNRNISRNICCSIMRRFRYRATAVWFNSFEAS